MVSAERGAKKALHSSRCTTYSLPCASVARKQSACKISARSETTLKKHCGQNRGKESVESQRGKIGKFRAAAAARFCKANFGSSSGPHRPPLVPTPLPCQNLKNFPSLPGRLSHKCTEIECHSYSVLPYCYVGAPPTRPPTERCEAYGVAAGVACSVREKAHVSLTCLVASSPRRIRGPQKACAVVDCSTLMPLFDDQPPKPFRACWLIRL